MPSIINCKKSECTTNGTGPKFNNLCFINRPHHPVDNIASNNIIRHIIRPAESSGRDGDSGGGAEEDIDLGNESVYF